MGCLGVHFALSEEDVAALRSQPSDAARLEYLTEELERRYFHEPRSWLAESDKAWDAIHRALTDGNIGWDNGTFPLSHVILGGEILYELDDYIMTLKTPWEVEEIAKALPQISADQFREDYFRIDADDYGRPVDQEDFEYTWHWYQQVHDLYIRAAAANRFVLFTASQ